MGSCDERTQVMESGKYPPKVGPQSLSGSLVELGEHLSSWWLYMPLRPGRYTAFVGGPHETMGKKAWNLIEYSMLRGEISMCMCMDEMDTVTDIAHIAHVVP